MLPYINICPYIFLDLPEERPSIATLIDIPEEHEMLKEMCRQFAEAELWPIAGTVSAHIERHS